MAGEAAVRTSVRARSSAQAPRLQDWRVDSSLDAVVLRHGGGQGRAGASPNGSNDPGERWMTGFGPPEAGHPGGRGAGTDGVSSL
jgi:hypothetical protein